VRGAMRAMAQQVENGELGPSAAAEEFLATHLMME
jgi:LAO/AO transport system kinase